MSSRWRARALGAVAALALLQHGREAAAAFSQATCPTTAAVTVPVALGNKEFDRDPKQSGSFYKNNEKFAWSVWMNSNVFSAQPVTRTFKTELANDLFEVFHDGSSSSPSPSVYTGTVNAGPGEVTLSAKWFPHPTTSDGLRLMYAAWSTNGSITEAQAEFTKLKLQCRSSQTTAAAAAARIGVNDRQDGVFLATGDVIHFQIEQAANTPMLLVLNSHTPDTDFDFFGSTTTSTPDQFNWQWAAGTSYPDEAMYVAPSSSARTIYVAVHSYLGAGHFTFYAHQISYLNADMAPKVCVPFIPTAAEKARIGNMLRSASARLLKMTNGNFFVKDWDVVTGNEGVFRTMLPTQYCGLILTREGQDRPYTSSPAIGRPWDCGVSHIASVWWSGSSLAHEYGHACLGLPDEYTGKDGTIDLCGHTIMGGGSTTVCTARNHLEDADTDADLSVVRAFLLPDAGWTLLKKYGVARFGPDFDAYGLSLDPTSYTENHQLEYWVTHVKFDGVEYVQ